MAIHPSACVASTAKVDPGAEIGPGVEIGDFAIIEDEVVIGPNTRIEPHVVVKRWTTLGSDNKISAGTILGTDPLDKSFMGKRSYLHIGNGNTIREHYTISRGTEAESVTEIGDGNYIMTSGHIAHNCKVGSNNVICSCTLIAGYVEIEDWAFISGGVGVQQYSRIGSMVMIAGNSGVNVDVPPYFLYAGFRVEPKGVNVVGLRRAGLDAEQIRLLKRAFRILYRSSLPLDDALERIRKDLLNEQTEHLIEFVRSSKRGISR